MRLVSPDAALFVVFLSGLFQFHVHLFLLLLESESQTLAIKRCSNRQRLRLDFSGLLLSLQLQCNRRVIS